MMYNVLVPQGLWREGPEHMSDAAYSEYYAPASDERAWEARVRDEHRDLEIAEKHPPYAVIHQILLDVNKLRKQHPAPIPQSAARAIDDFVFTMETKHGNRPSERWIGQLGVTKGGAGCVSSYEYEAGSVIYELDEEAEDYDAPLWLRVYVTTPNLHTVKL